MNEPLYLVTAPWLPNVVSLARRLIGAGGGGLDGKQKSN